MGDGPRAVVLLHGFLGSGKNLRALAQRWLERHPDHRFLLPDLRGHGASPPLEPGANPDTLADDVLATAASAGLTAPFAIVGHSLGGRVALAAARRDPARLSRVVMLDIGPAPIDPALSESRRVLDVLVRAPDATSDRREMRAFLTGEGLTPGLADWLLMNVHPVEGRYVWRFDRHALDALHDRFNRADLWPVVEARAVPLQCIRGGRSRYVSDADAARLSSLGVVVEDLPEAGHYVHVDAPEALLDHLGSV